MGQRRTVAGFGLAAVFAGAVAVTAPQAAANVFGEELAPGLSCEGAECTNDTDDTYRVESAVSCSGVGVQTTRHQVTTYIPPRRTVTVSVNCPTQHELGSWKQQPPKLGPDGKWDHHPPPVWEPGDIVFTHPSGVFHYSAAVDNSPPAAAGTGSFG